VTQASSKVTAAQQILDDADAPEEDKTKAQADLEAAQAELEEANKAVTEATDAAYAAIDAEADEVLKQLKDGADWETLMAEKTQDPGMQAGRETAETGYAVAEGMTSFDSVFVDAAMALKAVGDVSDKTRGGSNGYYIIKYFADQAEGAIPLDTVKDTLHDTLLSSQQTSHYNETVDAWVAEAGIKADMNALKD
jgi:foldase protein PrsA